MSDEILAVFIVRPGKAGLVFLCSHFQQTERILHMDVSGAPERVDVGAKSVIPQVLPSIAACFMRRVF